MYKYVHTIVNTNVGGVEMGIPTVLFVVPVGVLFILSGLTINLIQAILFILVRPLSKSMFRRMNKVVAEILWLEIIWLNDWWAGNKFEMHVDPETYQLFGKENALFLCNHRSDIDWLVGMVYAQRSGCLGSTLAITRKELRYLPIIGWSMWFSDYVFLDRSWATDEKRLKLGFQHLEDFPMPFWLAIFVEGTRFTKQKLESAQQHAASRGLPIPRNVLIPRTKGFVSAVCHLRHFVPVIYDATLTVANNHPAPTMLRMFRGRSSLIKIHLKRYKMEELPETADDIAQWCKDTFVAKDAFLEKYFTTDVFSDKPIHDIGRPKKSLFVVIFLALLLVCIIVEFIQWSQLFSSWEGIAIFAAFLLFIMFVMQILIYSSDSQLSTTLGVPTQDLKKEPLLPERAKV